MLDKIIAIKAQINALKIEQQRLEDEFINSHQKELEKLALKEYGCGTINIEEDGKKVKIEVKKTVKWDNEKLAHKFVELGLEAAEFIDAKYTISETKYKGWKEEVKEYFQEARTVTPSKPTLTIVEE